MGVRTTYGCETGVKARLSQWRHIPDICDMRVDYPMTIELLLQLAFMTTVHTDN